MTRDNISRLIFVHVLCPSQGVFESTFTILLDSFFSILGFYIFQRPSFSKLYPARYLLFRLNTRPSVILALFIAAYAFKLLYYKKGNNIFHFTKYVSTFLCHLQ